MCGIAGIFGLEDRSKASELIKAMANSLAHRGPDAEGFFVDAGIAFGHRRLSIIDLSKAADQPQFDTTGRYSIVLNGEIYNYREVKRKFPDYPFKTNSDTEVILAAYAKHGPDCLELLNGMFAVAIWDNAKKELFVARDRLGVKPLYYARTPDGVFVFASELRAILESGLIPRKLSRSGLSEYLMYQSVYSPATVIDSVYQLPAGEYIVASEATFMKRSYWQIDTQHSATEPHDEKTVQNRIRELLLRSVERRLVSDVRLGAFLSGGIDSSAVVGLMSEVSDQPVETFSVVFGEKDFDESNYSDLVARKFNTRHTRVELTPRDFLDELPNALRAVDSPTGDGFNTYIVAKATKGAGIKVALSGLGGDELFAGYPNFVRWMRTKNGILPKVPLPFRRLVAAALAMSSNSKSRRIRDVLTAENIDLAGIYPYFRQVMSRRDAHEYCDNGRHETAIERILNERKAKISDFPLLSQFSIAEMIGYTENVLLKDTDQFSMASALEVREPFFDYELVEYVMQVPDEIKFPKYPKSLLVESIAPLLPDEIVHRRKMGFVLPWEKWMRNELRPLCEARIASLADRSLVSPDRLHFKWKAFLNGSAGVQWSQLWHLIVLEEWLENNQIST
jgi:asparagine synthase (glutamine-hydrolysing)